MVQAGLACKIQGEQLPAMDIQDKQALLPGSQQEAAPIDHVGLPGQLGELCQNGDRLVPRLPGIQLGVIRQQDAALVHRSGAVKKSRGLVIAQVQAAGASG